MDRPGILTLRLDRRLLEHPRAFHLKRLRAAVWLYLVLAARQGDGREPIAADVSELARSMGLPEGTIRSWLGHLKKRRYLDLFRKDGSLSVRLRYLPWPASPPGRASRFFTVARLAQALGPGADRVALAGALDRYGDGAVRSALAQALSVPSDRIRKTRTALFLYLLTHAKAPPDPRP